nr:MAG TPA: Transcriptional regulator, RHH-like, CopG [Caudoviricetes sp.]
MKLTVQPSGTHLSDDEYKALTALLVKMGYTVAIRKEKQISRNLLSKVVYAEEEK